MRQSDLLVLFDLALLRVEDDLGDRVGAAGGGAGFDVGDSVVDEFGEVFLRFAVGQFRVRRQAELADGAFHGPEQVFLEHLVVR